MTRWIGLGMGLVALLSSVAPAAAQDTTRLRGYAASDSDEDKNKAIAQAMSKIVLGVLRDEGAYSLIQGERREKLLGICAQTAVSRLKWRERRGRLMFTCTVDKALVEKKVIELLPVPEGKAVVAVSVRFKGNVDPSLQKVVDATLSDYLIKRRFSLAPAKPGTLDKARGGDLGAVANLNKVPMVIWVELELNQKPVRGARAQNFQGRASIRRCMGKIFDRPTQSFVGSFTLRSDSSFSEEFEVRTMGPQKVHEPFIAKTDDPTEALSVYARVVGKKIAQNVVARIRATLKMPPIAKKGPKKTGEQPLREPSARDYYRIALTGFEAMEVDELIDELREKPGFGNWKELGRTGMYQTWKLSFVGTNIVKVIKGVLDELEHKAKIRKSGNRITLIKSP